MPSPRKLTAEAIPIGCATVLTIAGTMEGMGDWHARLLGAENARFGSGFLDGSTAGIMLPTGDEFPNKAVTGPVPFAASLEAGVSNEILGERRGTLGVSKMLPVEVKRRTGVEICTCLGESHLPTMDSTPLRATCGMDCE